MITYLEDFWEKHPALLFGIAAVIGCSTPLLWLASIALFLPLLFGSTRLRMKCGIAIAIVAGFAYSCHTLYTFPTTSEDGIVGSGTFSIQSISVTETFGKKFRLRGVLSHFTDDNGKSIGKNIPCTVLVPFCTNRPHSNTLYNISGTLRSNPGGFYRFIPLKNEEWRPLSATFSLADWRYNSKEKVKQVIHRNIQDPLSATFLSGIATGDFEDRMMAFEFGRFGLQHIMAISGFHFAIVAALFASLMRLFFSHRKSSIIMICIMTSYFVFLGCGPSILRAWVMVLLTLFAITFEREVISLNSLGVAILVILIYDPLLVNTIGFQFSVLTTAAILLFTSPIDNALQSIFSIRSLSEVVEMDMWSQHAYCIVNLIRKALGLTLAVNSVAIPFMLYYFQQFPLMSLAYNLFFPFLVAIAMFLTIVAFITSHLIPPIGAFLFMLSSQYTRVMLNLAYHAPTWVDFIWYNNSLTPLHLTLYIFLLGYTGIFLHHWQRERRLHLQDLAFL